MTTTQPAHLSVRDVDPDLWKQLRKAAIDHDLKVGELLNQILRDYLAQKAA
jgi:hypothetical protein